MGNHFGSFSNQVDGFHQQIVVEVFIDVKEKAHTHFPKSEVKNQSGKVKNKVFEAFGFLFDFSVVKG